MYMETRRKFEQFVEYDTLVKTMQVFVSSVPNSTNKETAFYFLFLIF